MLNRRNILPFLAALGLLLAAACAGPETPDPAAAPAPALPDPLSQQMIFEEDPTPTPAPAAPAATAAPPEPAAAPTAPPTSTPAVFMPTAQPEPVLEPTPTAAPTPTPYPTWPAEPTYPPQATYTPQPWPTARPTYTPAPPPRPQARPTPEPPPATQPAPGSPGDYNRRYRVTDPRTGIIYLMTQPEYQFFVSSGRIPPGAYPAPNQPDPTPWPVLPTPLGGPRAATATPPAATPQPLPTATPLPPQRADRYGWSALTNGQILTRRNPAAMTALRALPWTSENMTRAEAESAVSLVHIALENPAFYAYLMDLPWIQGNADEALRAPALNALALLTSDRFPGLPRHLQRSEFLRRLDSWDGDALAALYLSMSVASVKLSLHDFLNHPAVADGIDEDEARRLTVLHGMTYIFDPDEALKVLENSVHLETATVQTTRSGTIDITILRNGNRQPAATPSPPMQDLQRYLPHLEDYLDAPLPRNAMLGQIQISRSDRRRFSVPRRHAALIFAEQGLAGPAGLHIGLHMMMEADLDSAAPEARHVLAHETVHYWFGGWNALWIDEGLADRLAEKANQALHGRSYQIRSPGCPAGWTTAREFDQDPPADSKDPRYRCAYGIGYRFFHGLESRLGAQNFQNRLQGLYQVSRQRDLGWKEVLAAFPTAATEDLYYGR